jgi:hypothetical protein
LHVSEVKKNVDGIVFLEVVSAEDGKKGLCGPPPSPSIFKGGESGFTMRSYFEGYLCLYKDTAAGKIKATIKTVHNAFQTTFDCDFDNEIASNRIPATAAEMCEYSNQWK